MPCHALPVQTSARTPSVALRRMPTAYSRLWRPKPLEMKRVEDQNNHLDKIANHGGCNYDMNSQSECLFVAACSFQPTCIACYVNGTRRRLAAHERGAHVASPPARHTPLTNAVSRIALLESGSVLHKYR